MTQRPTDISAQKLVSVNVTTYNRAPLLRRCLDSILQQHYSNFEIIVVDDCSPDNTAEVMKDYCTSDNRIKYIRHEQNKGNAAARNTALQHGTGEYVAFMDDDDAWIDQDKLSKQVNIFEAHSHQKLGIVCSGVKVIDENNAETIKRERMPKDLVSVLLKGNGIIHNSTVLTRREIIVRVGGFDEKMPRGVDSDFFRRVVVKYKYKVYIMDDITTAYYEHGNERMTTNKEKAAAKTLQANARVIRKHFFAYLTHPSALFNRVFTRTKKILSYYK